MMNKFTEHKFIIVSEKEEPEINIRIDSNTNLETILDHMTTFIKSCGHKFDGYLEIIYYDDWK